MPDSNSSTRSDALGYMPPDMGFLVTCSVVCPERPIVPQKTVCYLEQRCRALSFFCLY